MTEAVAVTEAENSYDYAGQDPVNNYDLDGTVLTADNEDNCETTPAACGYNADNMNAGGGLAGLGTIADRTVGKTVARAISAAVSGCGSGAIVGLGLGAVSGADFTGYGALAAGSAGCIQGAIVGAGKSFAEASHVPGLGLTVEAVDWGITGKGLLGALGERLENEGYSIGMAFGIEKTGTGARFVWGIVIARE